ncbi:MAG: FAD-binding protein [Deltaproteobacteria bacterium]|nr:FAD-binding protein [Deltaproteobacteria bacterium]
MFEVKETDILVIGGGGAGIRAAITAAELGKKVILLSKGPLSRSGITPMAGEGVEGAVNEGDSSAHHYQDTIKAGRGLADRNLVYALAEDAVDRIHDLEAYGARFKKNPDGSFATSIRPGQTHSRNLFLIGGGYGLAAGLQRKMASLPGILLLEDGMAVKLLFQDGRVAGAVYLDIRTGAIHGIKARATIIATGGYEELWPFTDTPPDTTGEGLTVAYQAGTHLIDLEMVLYYPGVVVYPPAARGWLVQYEYILNPDILDGRVLNGQGEIFIQGFPARDEFIGAIRKQVSQGTASPHGGFFIDLSHSRYSREVLTERLETWLHQFTNLKQVGIDLRDDQLEMAPAAHYCLGGIRIDEFGRTNLPGLYAAGEVTGNVHGANRLSGNALSETQVFGSRAAKAACTYMPGGISPPLPLEAVVGREYKTITRWKESKANAIRPIALKSRLQAVMDKYMGLERDEAGLFQGLAEVRKLRAEDLPCLTVSPIRRFCYEVQEAYEVRSMLDLAEIVILSALERKETRGHHYRPDFPKTDETPFHTSIQWVNGEHKVARMPVSQLKGAGEEG